MHDVGTPLQAAVEALNAQRPALAEQQARTWLARHPGDPAAMTLLGLSLHAQGRPEQAAEAYRALAERAPHVPGHWSNLATMLRESGRLDEAEASYRHALELAPPDATLLYNLGLLLMHRGRQVESRDFLLRAHAADPASIEIRVYAAMMAFDCGDNLLAQRLLDGWPEWPPPAPELCLDLGWILGLLGHTQAAERLLREALDRPADALPARARLVMLLERSNRLDEARALLEALPPPQAITDSGLRHDLIGASAALLARNGDAAAAAQLESLLQASTVPAVRTNLLFLLARTQDRRGDAQAAMDALHAAHAMLSSAAAQLEPVLAAGGIGPLMRAARDVPAAQFHAWPALSAPTARQSPVFIVGFPRSGTTLLEQMLDAHPELCSMDERAFLQDLIDRMADWNLGYPEGLAQLDAEQCAQLRALYWRQADRTVARPPGVRLVDKNPLNLLRLPMIARLFPEAPILLALRHPCDVILSCYMQNFRSPAFALVCATLDSLAQGYANAMRFWIRHAALMRPRVLELRYEDLLDDLPRQLARVAEFLEVADPAPMLGFAAHARRKGFISTPSYAQVVQAPNKNAVGRWRRYAPWFEPLLPRLQPLLAQWGYARDESRDRPAASP